MSDQKHAFHAHSLCAMDPPMRGGWVATQRSDVGRLFFVALIAQSRVHRGFRMMVGVLVLALTAVIGRAAGRAFQREIVRERVGGVGAPLLGM